MIVYVQEQGTVIHRSGHTLVVQKEDFRRTIFVHRLEQLVVMGNVTLTNPAITLLCRGGYRHALSHSEWPLQGAAGGRRGQEHLSRQTAI